MLQTSCLSHIGLPNNMCTANASYLNFESCGSYFNSGVVFEGEMKERNKVSASPVIYCLAPYRSEILR